jgi:hypothetical protein
MAEESKPPFTPGRFWYSFLLEAEATPNTLPRVSYIRRGQVKRLFFLLVLNVPRFCTFILLVVV